jgi:hypothetical protein
MLRFVALGNQIINAERIIYISLHDDGSSVAYFSEEHSLGLDADGTRALLRFVGPTKS